MTTEILVTSEAGDKIATKANVSFQSGAAGGTTIVVSPDIVKQTIIGIGSSFTESSAFVLAHLDPAARARRDGQDIRRARRKLLADANADRQRQISRSRASTATRKWRTTRSLQHFSIASDKDGFARDGVSRHQGRDASTCCR